ncbi:serine-tRNA ligase [Alicycliphilus sp. B1]|nr:serine-tRNA ligase [Alicycliphilus sp. B1]
MKNSTVLETTSGSTRRFSCEYRPGATKAHTCHSTKGSAIRKAVISRIFSGTMKGEITEVAIMVAPCGRWATSGAASRS